PPPLPPIHTLPLWSMKMPWFDSGHSKPWPGPPHEASSLPALSNFSTGGAPLQHSAIGVGSSAPFSLLLSVAELRWMIQMLSCASAHTPMVLPSSQWLGNGFGQNGSTSNFGACAALFDCACTAPSKNP